MYEVLICLPKVLYQEENPGVEFEYSLKKDDLAKTPSGEVIEKVIGRVVLPWNFQGSV